jgi:hypothetical protein
MVIKNDGKVGIGTVAPAQQLTVVSPSNGNALQIYRNSTTTNDYGVLGFRISDTLTNVNLAEVRAVRTNRVNSGDTNLSFHTFSNFASIEGMRIRDDGLVGINETAPTAQLHVKSGAVDRVPLIVDTLDGQTADLQQWRKNTTVFAKIDSAGFLSTSGIYNPNGSASSFVHLTNDGTKISRDVADTNPALIVNLANASATGNIQVWQKAGSALSQISNAGIFVGQTRPTRTDITANATLALADEGKVLRVNSSSNLTVTIPKNSAVAFPIDTEIAILRYGTGTVSIAPVDGDVTLQSADGERKIKNRYGSVALKKIGTDEWVLVGSLEA